MKIAMLNTVPENETGLISELWNYFNETYLNPEMPPLDNFTLGSGTLISLQTIILGITLGIIAAAASSIYSKRYIGDFVRKVITENCRDAQSAKTLSELGYLRSPGVRNAIKSYGTLSRWICCVEEDEFRLSIEKKRAEFDELYKDDKKAPKFKEPEFKRDLSTMHFYLPEEKISDAEIKFEKKGTNWFVFILIAIGSILLAGAICRFMPDVIKMFDNLLTAIAKI